MAPADERPALRAKYGTSAVFAVHAVLQRLHTRKGKQELVDDGLLEAAEAVLPLDRAVRRKLERKTLEFVDYQASYAANSTGRGYGPGTVTHRPSAFKDASAAPRRLLTAARLDALLRDGIVWVDGALGGPAVGRAARELAEMKGGGGMFGHENVNRQLCNPGALSSEIVLGDAGIAREVARSAPGLSQAMNLLSAVAAVLEERLGLELCVPEAIMCGCYPPKAHYRRHLDSYGPDDTRRVVTAILYANEAWTPAMGGAFEYTDPTTGEVRTVDPVAGRLLLFKSRHVWHAVQESRTDRYAMTLWLWEREKRGCDAVLGPGGGEAGKM